MESKFVRTVLATAVAAVLAASPLNAQREAQHRGFWISFGFGAGNAFGDDTFGDDSHFGGAGFIRMGGSLSQQLLIGGEAIGWGDDDDDSDVNVGRGALLFTAIYYPSARGVF